MIILEILGWTVFVTMTLCLAFYLFIVWPAGPIVSGTLAAAYVYKISENLMASLGAFLLAFMVNYFLVSINGDKL